MIEMLKSILYSDANKSTTTLVESPNCNDLNSQILFKGKSKTHGEKTDYNKISYKGLNIHHFTARPENAKVYTEDEWLTQMEEYLSTIDKERMVNSLKRGIPDNM